VCRSKQSVGSKSTSNTAVARVVDELMVPKMAYDEKLQELLAKDETIQVGSSFRLCCV